MGDIKILIIGYGSIGQRHFSLLKQRSDVECVHYVSQYTEGEGRISTSLKLLSDSELSLYDVFFICSETIQHEEQLLFIDNKVTDKIILVEKPLFSKASQYIVKNKVLVTYNLRFHPVIQKIKVLLKGERLLSYSAAAGQYLPSWRPSQDYKLSYSSELTRGGGVLRDLSHEIDYTIYLCGEIKLRSALASGHSHLQLNSDDTCTILATNNHNAHIQVHMDYLSYRPKREIEIQTDNMTISASLIDNEINVYYPSGKTVNFVFKELGRDFTYKAMYVDILQNSYHTCTTYIEANRTMQLIDNITSNYMDKSWL